MRNIGILAAAVAVALCGCEAMGPGDGAVIPPEAGTAVLSSMPSPGELASPSFTGIGRPPEGPVLTAGTEVQHLLPNTIGYGTGSGSAVILAAGSEPGGGSDPTVGLQYDGSIAFRRGTK